MIMEISGEACDTLNERLLSLSIRGVQEMSLSDLNCTHICPTFLTNCNALLKELSKYDKNILLKDGCSSIEQAYIVLKSRPPYFPSNVEHIQFKLLQYLVAEIQVERLTAQDEAPSMDVENSAAPQCEMDIEDDEAYAQRVEHSILAFQLDKICKLLQVSMDQTEGSGLETVLGAVQRHVAVTLQQDPTMLTHPPAKILPEHLVLNAQQKAKLAAVEEMLHKDFALRREMLIKRMEVTVESFLWSEKASCRENEDEIRTAVRAQQDHLAAPPRHYQLVDAVEANVALLHEQSKKITGDSQLANTYAHHSNHGATNDSGGRMKSIIKQILVGSVPDRGGRANEVRPKQLREEVRRAFGGKGYGGGDRDNRRSKKGQDGAIPAVASASTDNNSSTVGKKGAQSNKNQSNDGKGGQERSQTAPANPAAGNHGNNNSHNKSTKMDSKANDKPQKSCDGNSSSSSGRKVELPPPATKKESAGSGADAAGVQQSERKNDKAQYTKGGRKR